MKLNLPAYSVKMRETPLQGKEIFDDFRKKYVKLTPEEWVRQHFLHFLCDTKHYRPSLISVEKSLSINGMPRRFDAVVHIPTGQPVLLLEFKAPSVKLTQAVFDQVAAYNLALHADYLIVSNGLSHYCCRMDYPNHRYYFLEEIPDYTDL
jgi:type I site-specific restriction-modification system R (restriction) subunit